MPHSLHSGAHNPNPRYGPSDPTTPRKVPALQRLRATIQSREAENARLQARVAELEAACEAAEAAMSDRGPPPICRGTLCEEQDWDTTLRLLRAALAEKGGGS